MHGRSETERSASLTRAQNGQNIDLNTIETKKYCVSSTTAVDLIQTGHTSISLFGHIWTHVSMDVSDLDNMTLRKGGLKDLSSLKIGGGLPKFKDSGPGDFILTTQ